MVSPLALLHEHVGTLISDDSRTPLSANTSKFDFMLPYPTVQNFKNLNPTILNVEVEYNGEKEGTALEVRLRKVRRGNFKNVGKFFEKLGTEVELFLNSSYEVEDDEDVSCIPDGWLYASNMDGGRYLTPSFGLILPFEKDDTPEQISDTFNSHLQYACTAMWFAAPILQFVSDHKCEPKAPERIRLLSIAHGTAMVMREETKSGKDIKLNFPEGFYRSRVGPAERRFTQLRMQ